MDAAEPSHRTRTARPPSLGRRRGIVGSLLALAVVVVASCAASGTGTGPTTTVPGAPLTPLPSVPVPTGPTTTEGVSGGPAPTVPLVRDTHIIYSAAPAGQPTLEIYRMRADGKDPVRLTNDPSVEHLWPRPSPDGSKILFYTAAPGSTVTDIDTNNLWVMDADGSHPRLLLARGVYGWTRQGHVEWSPDGTQLIMAAGGSMTTDLYVTDAEGRSPRKVTDRGAHMAIDPSWTPDGRGALFIGCPKDSPTCWWWEYEVFRIDLATGVEQRLTVDSFADFDPYMSPDGTQVVWLRCTGLFPFGPWSIFRSDASSRPLAAVPVVDDSNVNSSVDFSSDGSKLLFGRHVIGDTTWQSAAVVGVDGSGLGFVGGRAASTGQGTPAYWP